ncbi:HET-domain-containing protein [Apiospora hydei]|uniref:HET-domain-containing protein n=1 Tax=Apiospora hydei TaxID=1337664 RepID=A0ABR1UQ85_9PEZI
MSPNKIRLVVINPGDWDSTISCCLLHHELDTNPKYIALSYAWGPTQVKKPIFVDGIELPVTVNLESALRHLRRQYEPLVIWIDAIAINQDDLAERSHQVGLMRRIYQQASRVIVWLGDSVRHRTMGPPRRSQPPLRATFYGDARDDEQVADFVRRWAVPCPSAKYTPLDVFCFIRMLMLPQHEGYRLMQLHLQQLPEIAEALRVMLMSQWWTRMWVFQEVIVAPEVRFQYAGVEAPLDMFTMAAFCLTNHQYLSDLPSDATKVLHR